MLYLDFFLLKSKLEVKTYVQNFIHVIENQFQAKVKIIWLDNEPKLFLKDLFASKGFYIKQVVLLHPNNKGRVEGNINTSWMWQELLCFILHIPSNFLLYAIKHVIYLVNRVPSPINWNKTPFELLHKQTSDFSLSKFLVAWFILLHALSIVKIWSTI